LGNTIVQVWVPALGLFFDRFPANEDVERSFAFEYRVQLALERPCGSETFGGSGLVGFSIFGLLLDPVAQVAVCQLLVDQGVEAVWAAVPEMPNERAVQKEFRVLFKELIAQPVFESLGFAALDPGAGD